MTNIETYINNLEENTHTNPIYEIINSNDFFIINKKLKILHTFCHLYYCLKFKHNLGIYYGKK